MTVQEAKRLKKPDSLIINNPYREPERYWKYDREKREFVLIEGERRPAGYTKASDNSKSFDDPGLFVELPLVNIIRRRVKEWRENDWPGVTGTTRRLLLHWYDKDARQYPFFFAQLEAIETLIWLKEASPADVQGVVVEGDGGPFERVCTKLATGLGKTVLMAMTAAWQTLNRVANERHPHARYCKDILILAPGLTVRNRLSVLKPEDKENYYEAFGIVPNDDLERMRQARVEVLNWHKLDWESDEQLAKKKTVDKRGAKSDLAYAKGVLGDMATADRLLVFNDEAHHAWRVPEGQTVKGVSTSEKEEATKWVGGLDRIHRALQGRGGSGIQTCFDFSATPLAPTGKKTGDEQLFRWIVSDFGLNDAIESGLVKTPRVVIRDDGVVSGTDYKPKLYHIYPHVSDDLNRSKAEPHDPLPDLITSAYYLLGKDWLVHLKDWAKAGHKVPPVMITVANRTETAARIKYAFDHGKILIDELKDPDRTLHIDSKVLDKAEAQDEPVTVEADTDDDGDDDAAERPMTKKEQAEYLRLQVDTVGKEGQPGQDIQNVISVGMLSEGWDAKTVTHIMGLRAFTSQLLCEQVVGRGLRRTSYDFDEEKGLFEAEYVNIFGIPFSFMPHEGEDGPPPPPPPPKTEIKPLAERTVDHEITWPNVIKIERVYKTELDLDLNRMDVLEIRASDTPQLAEMAPQVDGKPDPNQISVIDLEQLAERFRFQKLAFEAALDVAQQMKNEWKGSQQTLLVQLVRLVERFLASDRLQVEPPLFYQDELRRRVLLALNMSKVVHAVAEAVREQNVLEQEGKLQLKPVYDDQHPIRSTGDMRPWYTSKPCERTKRSHINFCVHDSTWESYHGSRLDSKDHESRVKSWVKNDHLGFEVWYVYKGVRKRFRPDFLVRLADDTILVLETKGEDSDENRTKRKYLAEWVEAVNGDGGFGRWVSDVALTLDAVDSVLAKHSAEPVTA